MAGHRPHQTSFAGADGADNGNTVSPGAAALIPAREGIAGKVCRSVTEAGGPPLRTPRFPGRLVDELVRDSALGRIAGSARQQP